MKLYKIVLISFMTLCSTGVYADDCEDSVSRSNMSIESKAAMVSACREAEKVKTGVSTELSEQTMSNVVNQSEQIAAALAKAASGIGLAADAFIKTDAGKFVAVMIAWRVMGSDIMNIFSSTKSFFFGIITIIMTCFLARGIINKYILGYDKVEVPGKDGKPTIKYVVKSFSEVNENQIGFTCAVVIITAIFCGAVLINCVL